MKKKPASNLKSKVEIVRTHKGEGHRKRLRDKFLNSGLEGFHDYEVIELLLTVLTGYIN